MHKALHETETEVEVRELKTKKKNVGEEKKVLAKLCQVLKDHNSSYAQSLLRSSVDFCYNQALRHMLEETSDEEKRRLFPFLTASVDDTSLKDLKVLARLTVIDMEEYGIEIAAAIKTLKGMVSCRLWHGSRGVILKNRKNLNKSLVFEALYL